MLAYVKESATVSLYSKRFYFLNIFFLIKLYLAANCGTKVAACMLGPDETRSRVMDMDMAGSKHSS